MFSSLQPNIPRDSLIKSTDTDTDKKHNDIQSAARASDDDDTLLDFDVSKLESDIMKTVENNNNKLKELEHMLNEEKKSKQLAAKVSEDDEDVLPIVETISDDDISAEVVTKPASAEKVEEDYVVEDVTLLKKLIAETAKEDVIVETIDISAAVETTATPVDVVTTEKQIVVETSTENTTPSTTVALVTTLATTIKVRLFEPEVSLYVGYDNCELK